MNKQKLINKNEYQIHKEDGKINMKEWSRMVDDQFLMMKTGLTRQEYKERKKANRNLNKYMERFEE